MSLQAYCPDCGGYHRPCGTKSKLPASLQVFIRGDDMKHTREDCEREHPSNPPCSPTADRQGSHDRTRLWTREERERWHQESAPDAHERIGQRTAFLKITTEEMRRILATVDALEEILRELPVGCTHPSHTPESVCVFYRRLALLAALEGE